MTILATPVPADLQPWWWLALAAGLLVALIAVALLQLLYRRVRAIEEAAERIWTAGKDVARNTATSWMLRETARELDGLNGRTRRQMLQREGP